MKTFKEFLNESLFPSEISAVLYWQEGNNGWGYSDIRAIGNGHNPPQYNKLKDCELTDKARLALRTLKEITQNFEKALSKLPSVKGQKLTRFTSDYIVPEIGTKIVIPKYSSYTFNPTLESFRKFGSDNAIVYELIANNKFKNISNVTSSVKNSEFEAVNTDTINAEVVNVENKVLDNENNHKVKVVTLKI